MKQFHVFLSYKSIKHPQKVTMDAVDADAARAAAHLKYPNAEIVGPSAVLEIKQPARASN